MPGNKKPHITVILTGHREGWMIYNTIVSMKQAKQNAENNGLSVEVIIILDKHDSLTDEFIKTNSSSDIQVEHISSGDVAVARNHAVSIANGEFIAILDGDDLWSNNWLSAAYNAASKTNDLIIWHPEVNVFFGEEHKLFFHRDSADKEFNSRHLIARNYWTALSFGRISIYKKFPYPFDDTANGFAFEDWQWNIETYRHGILHMVVPQTTHFIRSKKNESRAKIQVEQNYLIKLPR